MLALLHIPAVHSIRQKRPGPFGFGLALYALARGQRTRAGITAGLSLAWWLIATEMSSAGGDHVNIRLGYLGSSKLEILTTLLTRPWSIFAEVAYQKYTSEGKFINYSGSLANQEIDYSYLDNFS